MIKQLNFAHLCDHAFILSNGTPGMIGIFSKITGKTSPVTYPYANVVLNFTPGDTEQHTISIIAKNPAGKILTGGIEHQVRPAKDKEERIGFIGYLTNLEFTEEGEYQIEIQIDKKTVATLPIDFSVDKK